jgi:hypothetical protein
MNSLLTHLKRLLTNPLISWLGTAVVSGSIFFYRFPNNFFFANFYAEDGAVFIRNVLTQGFFESLINPFNGYFIVGLYMLAGTAVSINNIFFNHLLYLPTITAVVSYAFLGLAITLPVLFFRKQVRFQWLLLYILFASFVPLPGWDYAIIGTIGNVKFFFAVIALTAILFLLTTKKESQWLRVFAYVLILIAGYTNPTVYLLCLALLIPYIKSGTKTIRSQTTAYHWIISTFSERRFLEYLFLGSLLSFQILFIAIYGIPEQPGYMNSPFEWVDAIEIFIARSFFFPWIVPFYTQLTATMSIWLAVTSLTVLYAFGERKHWSLYSIIIGSILAMTGLFVTTRPGISVFFTDYTMPGGPGQFFYPQNIAALFLFFFWIHDMTKRFQFSQRHSIILFMLLLGLLFSIIPHTGSFGKNNFMQKQGTFIQEAQESCSTGTSQQIVRVPVYPSADWFFEAPTKAVCDLEVLEKEAKENDTSFWIFTDNMQ